MIILKEPIDAIWKNRDHDIPVVVNGFDEENGELYFFIKESKTGLPAKEMLFPKNVNLENLIKKKEIKDDND